MRRCRRFIGDGVDGTDDPRELETDVDSYEPLPPLDTPAADNYLRNGRT